MLMLIGGSDGFKDFAQNLNTSHVNVNPLCIDGETCNEVFKYISC